MGQPKFILVQPQMGENIGASARAMWNFGLDQMRLVAPRDGWPNPAADALASGAGRLLDHALVAPNLAKAVADCTYVIATTARRRDLTKPVLSPERAMQIARDKIAQGQSVGVVFGPERAGLENADIALANALVTIPVNPAFPSLNLAQSVLLLGYEWRRQTQELAHETMEMAGTVRASGQEVEKLAQHYETRLDEAGFFFPPAKAAKMKVNLRNLWSRLPLTQADVQMLHGILRQLLRRKDPPGAP